MESYVRIPSYLCLTYFPIANQRRSHQQPKSHADAQQPDIAASHNMTDRRNADNSRHYQASTHLEIVRSEIHGGLTLVSGRVSFDFFDGMLGVAGMVEPSDNIETWLTGALTDPHVSIC
jgi:hypothetical protein